MLSPAKRLKQQLAADQLVVGLMATDHAWPMLVEHCKQAGLDYLVVDCEHGDFSDEMVSHICQVGRLAEFPILVRAISSETTVVRRIVDLGACGILVPNVESVEELEQVEKAVFMPPRGRRRPGGMGNYWVSDFQHKTWQTEFEEHFIVIPQIESRSGVDNAGAIARHPMVTAIGLGPYDLSADLGCCWNPEDDSFQNALATVRAAADSAGKKVWAGCDGPALRAEGYTFLWIGTVSLILSKGLAQTVNEVRSNRTGREKRGQNNPPPA